MMQTQNGKGRSYSSKLRSAGASKKEKPVSTTSAVEPTQNPDQRNSEPAIVAAVRKLSEQIDSLNHAMSQIAKRLNSLENSVSTKSHATDDMRKMIVETKNNTDLIAESTYLIQTEVISKREEKETEMECQRIKEENLIIWKEKMNRRKIRYWHCLQNAAKAQLYESWLEESPNYLPLKYRPKINENDSELLLTMKSEEAQRKYEEDIDLMYHYSNHHEEEVLKIESEMTALIDGWTESETHKSGTLEIWRKETLQNEKISKQLWDKRRHFLEKKKLEEEREEDTRFVNEEQAKAIEERSYLKRNRFKISRRRGRPTMNTGYQRKTRWDNNPVHSTENFGRNHDNWRSMCLPLDQDLCSQHDNPVDL